MNRAAQNVPLQLGVKQRADQQPPAIWKSVTVVLSLLYHKRHQQHSPRVLLPICYGQLTALLSFCQYAKDN